MSHARPTDASAALDPAARSSHFTSLREKIAAKTAKVGVIGLGYVGLPLIRTFVGAGFRAIGYDVDARKVSQLAQGRSYIEHIPSDWIASCVANGSFEATSDMDRLGEADVLLICVPTPLNASRDPDLAFVEGTAEQIARRLRPGQLVVLESTTYPGTTRDVVLPLLNRSNLQVGQEFFLAFSPEREDPGNPQYTSGNIPKVVGGYDPASAELAVMLYERGVVRVVPVGNCEVAEASKILENTYRAVNIALVNELKLLFSRIGIDVWEVIEAAKTKPFGFQAFYPGPGLGGHCIPIDPFYLTWLARRHGMNTRFIELAGEINTSMPRHVVHAVMEALNEHGKAIRGSRIGILGMAYKRDVDDSRESPSFEIMELLLDRGAVITYSDPHIPVLPPKRDYTLTMQSTPLTAEYLAVQDCVLIVTDHSAFDYGYIVQHAPLVVDTRNATRGVSQGREKIRKA
jgi:UDP-N-acetyl-D-glucosamine dehydrogenase